MIIKYESQNPSDKKNQNSYNKNILNIFSCKSNIASIYVKVEGFWVN